MIFFTPTLLAHAALTLCAFSLAIWLYLACLHGRFWLSGPVLPPAPPLPRALRIAVVIPARDEAESIERSLRSLLAQQFDGQLTVILVDDNSTDGTGDLARAVASATTLRHTLEVVRGAPLAPGWSGKLWAVHQGLQHATARAADYVLLTDADIEHTPDHLARLVAKAESEEIDLVSEMVRLHCRTLAERALIPAFLFFFQMLYPFRLVNSARSRVAGAEPRSWWSYTAARKQTLQTRTPSPQGERLANA